MTRGEYKLHWQLGKRASFAEITVSLEQSSDPPRQVRVAASVETSNDHWIEVAARACARCMDLLRRHAVADSNTSIVLENLSGMPFDTTDNAIEAAAVLAVADAFELSDEFVLQRRAQWHVEWPAKRETLL